MGTQAKLYELINAQEEYIKFLADQERDVSGIAQIHGFKYDEEVLEKGKNFRNKIEQLKNEIY